jgi:hypothetical protein
VRTTEEVWVLLLLDTFKSLYRVLNELQMLLNPSPIGLELSISNQDRAAIVCSCLRNYSLVARTSLHAQTFIRRDYE